MKQYIVLALKILFAVAGLAYIAWNIDWVDKVKVLPNVTLSDGSVSPKPRLVKVTQGEVNPANQTDDLTIVDVTPDGKEHLIPISAAELNNPDHFQLSPSIASTLKHSNKSYLLIGFLLVLPIYPIQVYRWAILLRARGIEVRFAKAFQLTMVGSFFNYCMPGSTGGDFIKAYYAASRSDRRTDAIMSVVFDRVTGLLGLILLGGVVGLLELQQPTVRAITRNVWIGIGLIIVGGAVYFSSRARSLLGVDRVLSKLPAGGLISKIDQAAVAYRDHKADVVKAILISLPVHLLLCTSTAISGYALGMKTSFVLLLTAVPVIFLSGALPITPQGAGVWEAIGRALLWNPPNVMMNQIVVMLVMIRLYQLVYSLLGVPFLLKGDIHLHPERDEAKADEPVAASESESSKA